MIAFLSKKRRNMAREEEERRLVIDIIREEANIVYKAFLQDLVEEEQCIRIKTTDAIEALEDSKKKDFLNIHEHHLRKKILQ